MSLLPSSLPGAGVVSASAVSSSSFYSALRLLPRGQREAMYEVYAFCRAVDDIADGECGSRTERLRGLSAWRDDVQQLYAGHAPAHLGALAPHVCQFGLEQEDFLSIIQGMEMDCRGTMLAPARPVLEQYCDCVAGAVGRLVTRIFGTPAGERLTLAHHLGCALQLTNILRDLDEDCAMGRLYLPREALVNAGIATIDPRAVLSHPRLHEVCSGLAQQARVHFAASQRIVGRCPRRTTRAPRIMIRVYATLLEKLLTRGWQAPRTPVRLSRAEKMLAAVQGLLL